MEGGGGAVPCGHHRGGKREGITAHPGDQWGAELQPTEWPQNGGSSPCATPSPAGEAYVVPRSHRRESAERGSEGEDGALGDWDGEHTVGTWAVGRRRTECG